MCMTRLNELPLDEPVTVEPMRAFPPIKDLVTDVSWNFRVKKRIKPFKPRAPDAPDGTWRMDQADVDRVQEFRKCIECFLCQDVCHVLRDHQMHDEFIGPRFLVYVAALEMHPLDTEDRIADLSEEHGIGYCNITKCCTKVCPEHITITDNAIIPLKERVVDEFYDPLGEAGEDVQPEGGRVTDQLRGQADLEKRASPRRCRRRSAIGSSTTRRPRRASASTCSRSTRGTSRRWSRCCSRSPISSRAARRGREAGAGAAAAAGRRVQAGVLRGDHLRALRQGAAPPRGDGIGRGGVPVVREAMEWYEKAEANRPPGNDEAILRWNTCARILSRDETHQAQTRSRPRQGPNDGKVARAAARAGATGGIRCFGTGLAAGRCCALRRRAGST